MAGLIGALLLVIGSAAFFRSVPVAPLRNSPSLSPPEPAPATSPPLAEATPSAPTTPSADSRLRVTLLDEGEVISGYVAATAEGRQGQGFREASGRGRAEVRFDSLPPGRKRIVFVGRSDHAPADQEITLSAGQEGELRIPLRRVRPFRGIVVDALRRPLAGVRVQASATGAFQGSGPGSPVMPLLSTRSISGSGGPGSTLRDFRSTSLTSDGRVSLATETEPTGRFTIHGLPGPSVSVTIGDHPALLTRACLLEDEAYLIVPVVPAPIPETETKEDLNDALSALAERLGRDPQTDAATWTQFRAELRRSVEESRLPALDKDFLRNLIESLGRAPAPAPK